MLSDSALFGNHPYGLYDNPINLGSQFKCPIATSTIIGASSMSDCKKDCLINGGQCTIVAVINPFAVNVSNTVQMPSMSYLDLTFDLTTLIPALRYSDHWQVSVRRFIAADSDLAAQLISQAGGSASANIEGLNAVEVVLPIWFNYYATMRNQSIVFRLSLFTLIAQAIHIEIQVLHGLYKDTAPIFFADTAKFTIRQATRNIPSSEPGYNFFSVVTQAGISNNGMYVPFNALTVSEYQTQIMVDVRDSASDFNVWMTTNKKFLGPALDIGYFGDSSVGGVRGLSELFFPYLPFFSSCVGYDSHMFMTQMFEHNSDCDLKSIDAIKPITGFDVLGVPNADLCTIQTTCHVEEKIVSGLFRFTFVYE